MRSQTDEQLAARWDPEPWVLTFSDGSKSRSYKDSARFWSVFAPRVECIPIVAPTAIYADGRKTMHFHERPSVNPILVMFRKSVADGDDDAFENAMSCAKGWPMHGTVTDEDRAFARKVLTRLAALA